MTLGIGSLGISLSSQASAPADNPASSADSGSITAATGQGGHHRHHACSGTGGTSFADMLSALTNPSQAQTGSTQA